LRSSAWRRNRRRTTALVDADAIAVTSIAPGPAHSGGAENETCASLAILAITLPPAVSKTNGTYTTMAWAAWTDETDHETSKPRLISSG
jgi:hypothetical protein